MPPRRRINPRTSATPGALDTQSDAVVTIQEDEMASKLNATFLGTVVLSVRDLNPQWPHSSNREVDWLHVRNLQNDFKKGVRRYEPESRLKATTTEADFAKILQVYKDNSDTEMDPKAIKEKCHTGKGSDFSDFVFVFELPDDIIKPILQAGQHRRLALLSTLEDQAVAALQGAIEHPGPEAYIWAVDLYDEAKITKDLLRTLRANRMDIFKPNTEGRNMAILIAWWNEELSEKERATYSKPKEFEKKVYQEHGLKLTYSARSLAVLRSPVWREIIGKYVNTKYGAFHFQWTMGEQIVNQKLNCFWTTKFDEFFSFVKTIFGDLVDRPTKSDWMHIIEWYKNPNDDDLRMLFFPTVDDYESGHLKPAIEKQWFSKYSLPRLRGQDTPMKAETRRPLFLSELSDNDYVDVWRSIAANKNLKCPTWDSWTKYNKRIMLNMKQLLRHVAFWIQPEWLYPSAASRVLKDFDWQETLSGMLFSDIKKAAANKAILGLLQTFAEILDTNSSLWEDQESSHELKDPPAVLRNSLLDDTNESAHASREQYVARFGRHHWARVLLAILEAAGPVFVGIMKPYNDKEMIQDELASQAAFGAITLRAQFRENGKIKKLCVLNTAQRRQSLRYGTDVAGAVWQYRHLKSIMVRTLRQGWAAGCTANIKSEDYIYDEAEWEGCKQALQEAAEILIEHGWKPAINDINEYLGVYTLDQDDEIAVCRDMHYKLNKKDLGLLDRLPKEQGDSIDIRHMETKKRKRGGREEDQEGCRDNREQQEQDNP